MWKSPFRTRRCTVSCPEKDSIGMRKSLFCHAGQPLSLHRYESVIFRKYISRILSDTYNIHDFKLYSQEYLQSRTESEFSVQYEVIISVYN